MSTKDPIYVIELFKQKNRELTERLKEAIEKYNESNTTVQKLDEELRLAYKLKDLGERVDFVYALNAKKVEAEEKLAFLQPKYKKLEAELAEMKKKANTANKGEPLPKEKITELEQKVVDSKKIAEESVAENPLKGKVLDLEKQIVGLNNVALVAEREIVNERQKQEGFRIQIKEFKLTILTKTLVAIRLKMNFKRQVFMLCKIMLLRRRRLMKAAGEKKDNIEKPDDHTDLLKNIWNCVAAIKQEQGFLGHQMIAGDIKLKDDMTKLTEKTDNAITEIVNEMQKQVEQNSNVELVNKNFQLQINGRLNETEEKLQNFERVLSKNAVEKKQKEQRKGGDSIKTDDKNKKKEATISNKKLREDFKTVVEESNKKVKELDIAIVEIGAKLKTLEGKGNAGKKYDERNERHVKVVFKNDTTQHAVYAASQNNLRDAKTYTTITSLLNSIENSLKDSLKSHSGVTISPEQTNTAWELHLENSDYKGYKEEWKTKSYLSPIFKRPYSCNMTQAEWDWQTNTNRILISPG